MDRPLTIVLLGHTGAGKSATGNTILGQKAFESRRSFKPVTTKISEASEKMFGRQISVIDTPGIICPNSTEEIKSFLVRVRSPCLFLVVLKIDRFTEEQEKAVKTAVEVIGERRLHLAYLLFTYGDHLDGTLEEFIEEDIESPLSTLAQQFNGRCLSFNNRDGGPQQVRDLLAKTGHMVPVSGTLKPRKVVLLGLSGTGKSSSGNTILGQEKFKAALGFDPVTTECASGSGVVEGRELLVFDTPGLTDQNTSPKEVATKIVQALQATGPEIHAFVIVVKLDRLSEADYMLLSALPYALGEEAARYMMVLFTHGDMLNGQPMDDLIKSSKFASDLVALCNRRYCVLNNNQKQNRQQVREFLYIVDQMVARCDEEPCRTIHLSKNFAEFISRSDPTHSPPITLDFSSSVPQEPQNREDGLQWFLEWLFKSLRSLCCCCCPQDTQDTSIQMQSRRQAFQEDLCPLLSQ